MAKELQLALLGDLRLTLAGTSLTGFDSNKARALLCYLAVTGRPHFRPALTGLLWGNMPETQAKTNLRVVLSNLRKLVGAHLIITRQSVSFNRDSHYWLDVEDFLAKLDLDAPNPDIDQLRVAVELYRGDFLEGFYVREAPEFEEWVLVQRERFRELALNTLHTLALHYAGQRRAGYTAAIDYTTRLLALDPWREGSHRKLMLLLARSGQRAAALAQYETCRQVLAKGLGVEPMPETVALYERLHAADAHHRHNLPVQSTAFIGREEYLAEINLRLANPACRLLTLVGPGGVGKTRLALHAATGQTERFLEGVCFVPLVAVSSINFIVFAIADALQISFYGGEEPKTQLLNYLREKEMLLVLDNFEHLLAGTNSLTEILQHAPEVKFLVTSRERLNLRGEWLLEVKGLEYPTSPLNHTLVEEQQTDQDSLESYSAVQLFLQSARQVQANFALADEDEIPMIRLCQLVEGNPLGLKLAAAWVRLISCQDIVQKIEGNLGLLATSWSDVPDRHRSLWAVFEHSWQLLSSSERQVFRKLSIFRGGFGRNAAEKVAGASLLTLARLVDKSLLRRNISGQYEIIEALRQYAAEKLENAPQEKMKTQNIHCDYYIEFLQQKEKQLRGQNQLAALEEISKEIENVRLAWQWAVAQEQSEKIIRSIESFFLFYEIRGRFQEGEEVFARAVARLDGVDRTGEESGQEKVVALGNLLARQGWFCFRLARYEQARTLIQKSLAIFEELGRRGEMAYPFLFLGGIAYGMGEYGEAKQFFQKSLAIYREIGDCWGMAGCLGNLGAVANAQEAYGEAKQFLQEGLTISREIGNQYMIAHSLNNLGDTSQKLKEYAKAKQQLQESIIFGQEVGYQYMVATALVQLGDVVYLLGEYAEAKQHFRESLAICKETGDQLGIVLSLNRLGNLSCEFGEYQESKKYLGEALQRAWNIKVIPLTLQILVDLAALMIRNQDGTKEQAIELLALTLQHPACDKETENRASHLLAELEAQLPPQITAAAQERGQSMSLEVVVAKILRQD